MIEDNVPSLPSPKCPPPEQAAPGVGDPHRLPDSPAFRIAGAVVAVVLAAMVLLPVAQAIARRLGSDIPGASIYVQHLTLWTGFLGAILATLGDQHLSLSTVNMIPAGRWKDAAKIFGGAVTAAVTGLLAYASVRMVMDNSTQAATLPFGIPIWWSETIMPVALAAIAVRQIASAHGGWTGRIAALAATAAGFGLGLLAAHAPALLWPGAIVILAAFLLGTPVYVAMAGLAMLLYFVDGTAIASVPNDTFGLVTKSTLPAVPLLTLAGYVLAAGGASRRLVEANRALLGWMPGGMALMALAVCALFTAFTGASGVTILAVGGVVYPSLREEGYPEGFSLGLVTASGSLGLLFPPSLPVILYGVVAEADIKSLYLAGLVPCGLIIVLVAAYAIAVGVRAKTRRTPFEGRAAMRAIWRAKWDLALPVVVGGAILSGLANIVEAAALGALYAVIVEVVIFRNLHPRRDLPRVMASAAALVGAVVILMGVALALTQYLALAEVPNKVLEWVQAHVHTQWVFLLALNVILLVLGSVLEMYSAIVVLAPLIVPLGAAFGVNPVHLGVVFLANLELGFLLPPMGLNLFLSATRFGKPLPSLYRHAFPFLLIMSLGVLAVTYLDGLTTGMLKLFGVAGA